MRIAIRRGTRYVMQFDVSYIDADALRALRAACAKHACTVDVFTTAPRAIPQGDPADAIRRERLAVVVPTSRRSSSGPTDRAARPSPAPRERLVDAIARLTPDDARALLAMLGA